MKFILIAAIKLYRLGIRPFLSKTCLFKESCSVHVERITNESGLRAGINALRFRTKNCQPGYHIMGTGDGIVLITQCRSIVPRSDINPALLADHSRT